MSDDNSGGIRYLDSQQPLELSTICLEAGISYDRVASIEVSATGEIYVGVLHRFSAPKPGRSLKVPFRETNFLQSVACYGRLIFFEATKALWELKVLPDLLDMLVRLRPPLAQGNATSRNMLFATPVSGEVQQFVFEPGREGPRIGHLSLPGSTTIRSVRVLPEFDFLAGIATDRQGASSIVVIPTKDLTFEAATNPESWKRVAAQPSAQMRQLSSPVISRDSSNHLRAAFMVSLANDEEVSLVLVKESDTDIRAIWGRPVKTEAVTVSPDATPNHVKQFRSSKSSSTIQVVDVTIDGQRFRPYVPS